MKAIILKDAGGIDQLIQADIATPETADNEVLVQVKSIGINPVETKNRSGKAFYGQLKTNPIILGTDISGVVTVSKSPLFKPGDEVFGMINFPDGRAYAEYVAAPADQLALKPANVSHAEAAAATLAALTALQGLQQHGKMKAGDRVLVTAASGGVGHYGVQLAKSFGAYVIGTGSAANKDMIISLGVDEFVDYKSQSLADAVKEVDFILDTTNQLTEELPLLKKGGQLITIRHGVNDEITAKATALGVTAMDILVTSNGKDMQQIAALMEQGKLRSIVSETFSLDEMGKAHLHVEAGRTKGKIVVNI